MVKSQHMKISNNNYESLKVFSADSYHEVGYGDKCRKLFLKSTDINFLENFFFTNDEGMLEVDSVFDDGKMYCKSSFLIGEHNFLVFFKNENVCIIIQQFGVIDAFYFPEKNVLLQFLGGPNFKNCIQRYINYLRSLSSERISRYLGSHNKISFLLGHSRPYHFFYDQLPAYEFFYSKLINSRSKVYTKKGWDFFGVDKLFPGVRFLRCSNINNHLIENNEFSVRLCVRKHKAPLELYNQLDSRLRACSGVYDPNKLVELNKIYSVKKNGGLALWFGITGQKRSWLSQVTGISEIIKYFAARHKGAFVAIIDGWTSHIDTESENINEDVSVFNSISTELINTGVKLVSIVGWNSSEKIHVGQFVDAHLSNHASGSLHISRICRKKGVTHLNKRMNKAQYIHHNVVEIKDIVEPVKNQMADHSSYDFDYKIALKELKAILEN